MNNLCRRERLSPGFWLLALACLLSSASFSQSRAFDPVCSAAIGREYCRRLEKASPWIRVTSFGKSPDLNRDYLKADAPETQAWLRMFTAWLPDFFIDCHVTDGADFQYAVTYGIESHENVAAPVRSWKGHTAFSKRR